MSLFLKASIITLTIAAAIVVATALLESPAYAQTCPGTDDPPTPTEVAVTAVPIVVTSTTADYFVLYTSHEVDGTTVEYPVQVTLGADGTTTLAENVAALPVERYRVEKYLIADPADVDGDCTDDITELEDPTGMNPVNPAVALELSQGAVSIPDRATFETLSYKGTTVRNDTQLRNLEYVKFMIVATETDRPVVYFQNTNTYRTHPLFARYIEIFDHPQFDIREMMRGEIVYHPNVIAPDSSLGVYRFQHRPNESFEFEDVDYVYGALAASMPLLDNNLAYYPVSDSALTLYDDERAHYDDSRINVVLQEDIFPDVDFIPHNLGEGYGFLRVMSLEERPNPRDIVIYESLPNELSRVAGIISTVPQTPLSHVNLRAIQDEAPNAFIRGALEDSDIEALVDSHVYYEVSSSGYSIRAATQAEVDEHYDASRPAEAQTPERDLSVTTITSLGEVGFDDWDAFGVKAANVAVLGTLEFPEGTVPDGFAIPFYFYDEFMKHNDLYDDIEDMLADPDFQSDYDTKADELKKLRKKIKKAETPAWIDTALTTMHATFAEGTSLRYRSSTNNEDLPDFSGAGLYDSKTQHPDETTEDGISKSLKQVYASLWNFRAFIERDFHRVDHMAAAMGVLVHPNYSDESVNGVAVSTDPVYGTDGAHYVNSQAGEDLVTNPEANSVPEEVLLHPDGTYTISAFSNQAPRGQLLMTDDQLGQLRARLDAIHDKFAELYDIAEDEQFAMEIEFKITSDDVLAIKQARPWIFASEPLALHSGVALTGSFEGSRTTHDGETFRVVVEFGDVVDIDEAEFKDHAVSVTGGLVERVARVAGRAKEWLIRVAPDSLSADVTVALAYDLPCTDDGAICTLDGRRLSSPVEHTVKSVIPRVPDMPVLRALSSDAAHLEVHLEWNDTDRADSYEVQFLQSGKWTGLPAGGTDISYDGASVVVSGLPAGDVYSFRVRGVNSDAVSAWSADLALPHRIVLESELTAGRQADIVPVESGYSIFGNLGGTLSPDLFVLEGRTHRVQLLVLDQDSLWLGISPELPADFILRVGDSTYLGSQSMNPDIAAVSEAYWWPSTPPVLFGDDPVRVRLILHPDDQLGDRQKAPVTAFFSDFPTEHVRNEDVSFRITFSDEVATTADALRDHVLSVSGGTVSGVEAVGSDKKIWAVSVTPDSRNPVTIAIPPDLDCALPNAICTADGRRLFNRMELTVEPRPNNPATEAPTISGTAEVGETLTADTSGISDADGMTGATFSYQWVSYDGSGYTDIVGATDTSYTPVSTDEGRAFRVRVSFTDDAGYEESFTSELAHMSRPYGLTATALDGAVTLTWKLPAGFPYQQQYYRIMRNRPELGEAEPLVYVRYTEEVGPTYTDTDVEPGVLYVYRVKGVDFLGLTHEASVPFEIRTAESTPVENSPAAGAPTIGGSAQVDEMLTTNTSGISDSDGLANATFAYQWIRVESNSTEADITGATGSSYTLVAADQGKTIKVKVSFTDDGGNDETLTSTTTTAVTAAPPPNNPATGAPTISGTAEVGETLTADTSGISDADGMTGATFSYQWVSYDGSNYEDIAGATGATYTPVSTDEGRAFRVRVSFTDDAGYEESFTSELAHMSRPYGLTATASDGAVVLTWKLPTGFPYQQQYYRIMRNRPELGEAEPLVHVRYTEAVGPTYTDTDVEPGVLYVYRVKGVDFLGYAHEASEPVEVRTEGATPVENSPATGAPAIGGAPQVGETLTVDTSGIADTDGLGNATFSYQWLADDRDISEATGSTYTLGDVDEGRSIKVRVSFTDDADNPETLTSAATAAVESRPNSPATGAPAVSGTAEVGETLTVDTSRISDADGLTGATFSYQWVSMDGGSDTDISGATDATYTLVADDEGKTIKVRVSFTDTGGYHETLSSAATIAVAARTSTDIIIVDQPGTVSLWPELPRVGTVVSATLTDPDGLEGAGPGAAAAPGAVSWQWARSSEGSTWTSFDVYEDGDSYTPTEDDEGMWLKVTAVYTDGHGQGKSAEAITAATVGAREASPELTVTELATGLTHPWDIVFTPDGTMLFTERDDGLRVRLTDGTVRQVTADFSDLNFGGTAGLLALVLDPDFVSNRRFYTYQSHTGPEMQVIAWTIDQDYTAATRVADPLVGGIPVNPNRGPSHGGGRLRFGPEGYLWIATGDGFSGTAAQDLSSLGGKVLRVDSQTGAGAPDNPFAPSLIYTYGHRNPQGLALRSGASQMWSVEHGPDHDDEINLLVSGGNYGWDPAPNEGAEDLYDETTTPMTDLVKFPDALKARWSSGYPTLAVGGGVFLEGSHWLEWEGQFAVATLKTRSVRVFKFTEAGDLVSQVVVPELDRTYGRLRTAVLGSDGALYITTTNGGGKDKILKVVPANSPATGAPTISGAAEVGETLTADRSGIADEDGLDNAAFRYQWLADNIFISGATGSSYTLVESDEGRSIKVRVSFTDDADNPETLTSAATAAVESRPNSPATGVPAISGTGQVGETLTVDTSAIADTDGMNNAVFTYQWLRMDGAAESTISGATSSTYVVAGADEGHAIKVRVSFTDDDDFSESLTSSGLDIPVVPLEGHFDAATVPASHGGLNSTFTFQLYFSVEPTLGFVNVRDNVLTLTNGDITAVRRTSPSSNNPNSRWEITVQPSGSNALSVALNPTTDCGLDSAVCTSSGKMLSNSASITVAGP